MTGEIYFLSSLDSVRFEPVRECRVERRITFDTGKIAVEATLSPSVDGQDFNRASGIDRVLLSCRHENVSIDPISEFPCFVFIAVAKGDGAVIESPVRADNLEIIGWGELYRTRDDAERHSFG